MKKKSASMLKLTIVAYTCYCILGAEAKMPTAQIGKNVIKLEVASSVEEIQKGLMYRTYLPEDSGMVFVFYPSRPTNFWMYHTLIPLDMLFIKDGTIVEMFEQVPPYKGENPGKCPVYPKGPGIEVSHVIEVNGGWAKRHGVNKGDKVTFEFAGQSSK